MMRTPLRHRFPLALGAASLLWLSGCTVSDAGDKAPPPGAAAASTQTATPGATLPAASPAGASAMSGGGDSGKTAIASTPASGSSAAGTASSNMSPDSVDVDHATPAASAGATDTSARAASTSTSGKAAKAVTLPLSTMRLDVDLATKTLSVYDGDRRIATHSVSIGSPQWPTQTGDWNVVQVIWNPEWIPPDETWAEQKTPRKSGAPDNPLGRAQLVYDPPRSIHGTNEPASIGKAVSHGSIRLPNTVVAQLGRRLMQATGAGKDDAWYRRVQQNRTEKVVVDLPQRVPIRVH